MEAEIERYVDPAIAATVVFLMTLVGTELTRSDLASALRRPRLLASATVAQIVLLPAVALLTARLLGADASMTVALLLVGTAPGGALSNVYAYLLGADIALSVTLTALTTALAAVTMPLTLGATVSFALGNELHIAVPGQRIALDLFAALLLPLLLGMSLRMWRPAFFAARERALRTAGSMAVAGVLLLVLAVNLEALREKLPQLLAATVLYTILAALAGLALAMLATRAGRERVAVVIEFTCRNTPAALLVATVALGRDDLAVFAALLLIVQAPLLFVLARRLGRAAAR